MTFIFADLTVYTTPNQLNALEGFYAVFECYVIANVVDKIEWSRDFEPLHEDKVNPN